MDGIVATDDVMGGEPRIEGRRISVQQVVELVFDGGEDPADVADELGLSVADVHLALAYHYRHPEEMREIRERHLERMRRADDESIEPPETVRRCRCDIWRTNTSNGCSSENENNPRGAKPRRRPVRRGLLFQQ